MGAPSGPAQVRDDGSTIDHETVAANASGGVFCAQRCEQSVGRLLEHCVAGLVAAVLVDSLESVEIAEKHGEFVATAVRPGECLAQTVGEQNPIRQTRERIVQCCIGELLFDPYELGDVTCDAKKLKSPRRHRCARME